MKIFKIEVENFRLLKDFSIDLEDELSLVIGKNNTGKTSMLAVLDKFLNQSEKNKFHFDDFNIDFKREIIEIIENDAIPENDYKGIGIKLKLFIEYTDQCNLENISKVMMDLDPENNFIVLGFEYLLLYDKYLKLRKDWGEFELKELEKRSHNEQYTLKTICDFLKQKHANYFEIGRKSIEINKKTKEVNEANFIDLKKEGINIQDIVNFKYISARREVANKEVDKTLSIQTSRIYEKTEKNEVQNNAVEDFKDKLGETDGQLSTIYSDLFEDIIQKVKSFGGIKASESDIEVVSTLQHRELLKGNTTVVYKQDQENKLPEYYNGLGYMNLIYMIFEIEILLQEFKREKEKKPADINLLFIEEPEAHTHPQMQYVFIKNIKKLLKGGIIGENDKKRKLQYIISTHSSHIVADSDFDDIKYLKKGNSNNNVVAKNLKDLKAKYGKETKQYQFLTQYLTISRAETFFAEKAVLIEGDTERILLPAIMKKIDTENATDDNSLPLLSQNISIIEVGAYSQIYDWFIDFLGIKTLIITDLDATKEIEKETRNGKKIKVNTACRVSEGEEYSNKAISHYFNNPSLADLKSYTMSNKKFNKTENGWENQDDGKLCVVYQTLENDYNARSFEDAFLNLNRTFVKENFRGLKNQDKLDDEHIDAYELAEKCINKKTHFALDILYHSDATLSNWQIPAYIKEGLLWLKQD